ncbi:TRAP transporter small permease [Chelatococcus sp. GCM10030263]|uniref:TRAP transporter small permease n=1 Tax=Chelatococcus sp. GCM10030263 TaxID=3273387 RepID=UPI003613E223
MRSLIVKIATPLRHLLDVLTALLLAAVLTVTFVRVVARYALGEGLPWSEELTRLLFVWLVMMGAARAAHLRVDLVPLALPARARGVLELATAALSIGITSFLVVKVIPLIELTRTDYYTALGVSLQFLYWSVVVGGCLWIVSTILGLFVPIADEDMPPS